MPDFIAVTDHGVICTGGSKLAEHGGFSDDDRNVALLLSAPDIKPQIVEALTNTTQIAPTILAALGLDPNKLEAVRAEGTAGAVALISDPPAQPRILGQEPVQPPIFLNFRTKLSASPIAWYFARSTCPIASTGGSVQTPFGQSAVSRGLASTSELPTSLNPAFSIRAVA